mmetsp:Transcript_6995/g.10306  ORF Transcript_6995/g.10306 Transcript_6995/m.10306 type:complete len:175 (-) Transcript_6995:386-910(-)
MAGNLSSAIRKELAGYQNLEDLIEILESKGLIKELASQYSDIACPSQHFKENLKLIVSILISQVWHKKQLDKSSRQNSYFLRPKRSVESLRSSVLRDDYLSEFSYGKGFSFSRDKKDSSPKATPGPGHYNSNPRSTKDSSPSFRIPKSPRKDPFLRNSKSPGPVYSPKYHFISK